MANPRSPLRLTVRTEAGQVLGTVVDVTIEPDTQSVVSYHVKPNRLVPDMVWSPLLVHRNQVVTITDKELIVDNATMGDRAPRPAAQPSS